MPRTARAVVPNFPHHVVQRGHNRQAVFFDAEDYRFYLGILRRWKEQLGCRLYAYCLMTNHVHLVVDPGEEGRSLGALMKRVAARQTRRVNKREVRSGTLWESRFKSSPIDTERYLLACCRYVEMNPVRAAIIGDPAAYPWSSHRERSGITPALLLDALPVSTCPESFALAHTLGGRPKRGGARTLAAHYRDWIMSPVPPGEWDRFRLAVRRGQLTGNDDFVEVVCAQIGRRIETRGPGNPGSTGRQRALPQVETDAPPPDK